MTSLPRDAQRASSSAGYRRARRRSRTLALATLFGATTVAGASFDESTMYAIDAGQEATHAVGQDALMTLLREHARDGRLLAYLNESTDASYARWVLGGEETPYADLVSVELSLPDASERRALQVLSGSHGPVTQRQLHEWKVWDLGFTKVGPMRGAPVPDELRSAAWGVPHIMKAGIDPDIYKACMHGVLDIGHPAIQANYALALQLLRERLIATPRTFWYIRGLRVDVMGRFLDPARHGQPGKFDFHYLIELLDGELSGWRPAGTNLYGFRQLPATLRLGRIAAAYQEAMPRGTNACRANGEHDPAVAGAGDGDGRPLCFTDATDRAIYRWYARSIIDELMAIGPIPAGANITTLQQLAGPLVSSSQGHLGIPLIDRMGQAITLETVHAKAALQLLSANQLPARQGDVLVRNLFSQRCGRTP